MRRHLPPCRATPAQLQELVAQLVDRIETADRQVTRVVWTPPARPFFAAGEAIADDSGALLWCPGGLEGSSTTQRGRPARLVVSRLAPVPEQPWHEQDDVREQDEDDQGGDHDRQEGPDLSDHVL